MMGATLSTNENVKYFKNKVEFKLKIINRKINENKDITNSLNSLNRIYKQYLMVLDINKVEKYITENK
jgi:hypothetical protein